MKNQNLKIFTVTALLTCASAGQALAEADNDTTNTAATATTDSGAAATQLTPATRPPAYPPQYRGYPPRPYGYDRGWTRPFGNDGPSFRGPWNKGSGFGFGSGPSWGSGPNWNSGPRYYGAPDYRPRGGYNDRPYGQRPYYDSGRQYRGPNWNDNGMSFGW